MKKSLICVVLGLLVSTIVMALSVNYSNANDQPTLAIINPGPTSKPTKWNATLAKPEEIGTNNFTFYLPQTPIGSTFFINITIKDVTNLKAWGIGLVYDNTTLRYLSAWRPTDHVFSYPESQGATPIAPAISIDDYDATHKILKWGYAYLWQDEYGNPIQWGFNGTGTLCQIQFQLIRTLSAEEEFSQLWFDEEWTSIYVFGVPSPGKIPATLETAYVKYFVDNVPPVIENPQQTPATEVQPNQPVLISVNVTDVGSGVKSVTLNYTSGTSWTAVSMQFNATSGLYEATIPGFSAGTHVQYKIEAEDYAGNKAVNDNNHNYFVYTVVPEFTSLITLLLTLIIASAATILAKRKKF